LLKIYVPACENWKRCPPRAYQEVAMHVRLGEQGPTWYGLKLNSNIIISSLVACNIATNGHGLTHKSTFFSLYAKKVEILKKLS
jgi:hypothetical protein